MKENILGINVSELNYDQLADELINDINNKKKVFVVAINPEKIMKAQKDPPLKELLNFATYQIPDGIGVILASKIKGGKINSRVTGIDSMLKLCEVAAIHKKKIFLYGAKPGIAEKAKEELIKRYQGLQIVGTIDGYEKDQTKIKNTINEAKPDILFVALGSPRQENWIIENMKELYPFVYQGVGGSFDVLSGNIKRAPVTFQKLGLEWLYRLIKEPWRWKRQLVLIKFLIRVLIDKKNT